jgi:hypothetical protein
MICFINSVALVVSLCSGADWCDKYQTKLTCGESWRAKLAMLKGKACLVHVGPAPRTRTDALKRDTLPRAAIRNKIGLTNLDDQTRVKAKARRKHVMRIQGVQWVKNTENSMKSERLKSMKVYISKISFPQEVRAQLQRGRKKREVGVQSLIRTRRCTTSSDIIDLSLFVRRVPAPYSTLQLSMVFYPEVILAVIF